jgi:hypothetical protein
LLHGSASKYNPPIAAGVKNAGRGRSDQVGPGPASEARLLS